MNLSKHPALAKALEGNDMAKLQLMSYVGDCEKADAIAFANWLSHNKTVLPVEKLYLKYLDETIEE